MTRPLLTVDEERELGRRIQNGDRASAAIQELIDRNQGLAGKLTRGFRGPDYADARQEADLALHTAAKTWIPGLGSKFGTYAGRLIRNRLRRLKSKVNPTINLPCWSTSDSHDPVTMSRVERYGDLLDHAKHAHLSISSFPDMSQALSRDLAVESSTDEIDDEDEYEHVNNAILGLNPFEQTVIRLTFGLDCDPISCREFARRIGRSGEWIRKVRAKALAKLRMEMHA